MNQAVSVKPVKLQANTSGAWRDVIKFDAANDLESAEVMSAAETLGRISKATFRVVIADEPGRSPTLLASWMPTTGWKAAK